MNYGKLYQVAEFKDETVDKINEIISSTKLTWETGTLQNNELSETRVTDVAWLDDPELLEGMLSMAQEINIAAGWNLDINGVEPIQLGHYHVGGFYKHSINQPNRSNFRPQTLAYPIPFGCTKRRKNWRLRTLKALLLTKL